MERGEHAMRPVRGDFVRKDGFIKRERGLGEFGPSIDAG